MKTICLRRKSKTNRKTTRKVQRGGGKTIEEIISELQAIQDALREYVAGGNGSTSHPSGSGFAAVKAKTLRPSFTPAERFAQATKEETINSLRAKREVSLGIKAWQAFVADAQKRFPDKFKNAVGVAAKTTIAKAIRDEDPDAYERFVATFKNSHRNTSSFPQVSGFSPINARLKAQPLMPSQFSSPAAERLAQAKTKAGSMKPEKKADQVFSDESMPTIIINGVTYFYDAATNGLYSRESEGVVGSWIGYYQPDNKEEPIRFTEAPDV